MWRVLLTCDMMLYPLVLRFSSCWRFHRKEDQTSTYCRLYNCQVDRMAKEWCLLRHKAMAHLCLSSKWKGEGLKGSQRVEEGEEGILHAFWEAVLSRWNSVYGCL